jgi:hypothetical protein
MRNVVQFAMAGIALCLALTEGSSFASAVTIEQLVSECRTSVGRPIFQACMGREGFDRGTCRASARPYVRQCVRSQVAGLGLYAVTFTPEARARRLRSWCRRNASGNKMFALREARGCFAMSPR